MKKTIMKRDSRWPKGVAAIHFPFMADIKAIGEGPFAELMRQIEKTATQINRNPRRMSARFEISTEHKEWGRICTSEVTYYPPLPKKAK